MTVLAGFLCGDEFNHTLPPLEVAGFLLQLCFQEWCCCCKYFFLGL